MTLLRFDQRPDHWREVWETHTQPEGHSPVFIIIDTRESILDDIVVADVLGLKLNQGIRLARIGKNGWTPSSLIHKGRALFLRKGLYSVGPGTVCPDEDDEYEGLGVLLYEGETPGVTKEWAKYLDYIMFNIYPEG